MEFSSRTSSHFSCGYSKAVHHMQLLLVINIVIGHISSQDAEPRKPVTLGSFSFVFDGFMSTVGRRL